MILPSMRLVTALLALAVGVFIPPPKLTPSQVIATRWGEFEQWRSLTIDPVELLLALTERKTSVRDAGERP